MITQQRLKELFNYCPDTGILTQKTRTSQRVKVGEDVGCLTRNGYLKIFCQGRNYRVHRLAWLYVYGDYPDEDIDHINGIRTDNRLCNLRLATRSQNNCNSKLRADNKTSYRNVHFFKRTGTYQVQVRLNGKRVNGGYFATAEEASVVATKMRKQLHGEFAKA